MTCTHCNGSGEREVGDITYDCSDCDSTGKAKCLGCDEPTTGSIGAAGIPCPELCQACKDKEDHSAEVLAGFICRTVTQLLR